VHIPMKSAPVCNLLILMFDIERLSKICSFIITFGLRKSQSFLTFSNRQSEPYYEKHYRKIPLRYNFGKERWNLPLHLILKEFFD